MTIKAINPATGEVVASYDEMTADQTVSAIKDVHEAFLELRRVPIDERAASMRRAAVRLSSNAEAYGRLMAREMGKPIRDGIAEAKKCATTCTFFADNAARFLAAEPVDTGAGKSFVTFQPLGVVLAVMPWNFPFWQVFRAAVPALMAGNAMVLKHASNVPGSALAVEEVFRAAGFPKHLFRTLLIGSKAVAAVIEHPLVRAVTFTGGSDAGREIAKHAGSLLKKTVLELGGSDPYLVLADADLDHAVDVCVKGRLTNSGQSCIAAKRFIVVDEVRAEFERRFVARMSQIKMGDPLDPATEIGPQAREDLREALHRQVTESTAKGARCLLGGKVPDGPGAYYPPTVLTDVKRGMPAYDEEVFGPVAAIIAVADEAEAIKVANDSTYGLGAGILSRDVARAERIAINEIESGSVFVNDFVKSDPHLPFGGVKNSGYGRELSAYGLKEFVNIKTIVVASGS